MDYVAVRSPQYCNLRTKGSSLSEFFHQKTYHYRANACLGYSDTLIQLGEYYLFDFEIGFSERHIGDAKRVFAKQGYRHNSYFS